jgi:hypothetical protein
MTHRIITAEEARTLREAATPGPWGVTHMPHGWDFCLVRAAPDLAATVEALHAEVERAASAERSRIVAWLRAWADAYEPKYSVYPDDCRDLADRIERGEVTP